MWIARTCISGFLTSALAFCPCLARADNEIDPALLGRALGFDLSYQRECVGPVPATPGQLVFLTEYSAALVHFSRRFSDVDGDNFLYEFIHSSVRTQFDCAGALTDRDSYWDALEARGLSKTCLIRAVADINELTACLSLDE